MPKVQFDLEGNFEPAISGADKFNKSLEQTKKSEDDLRKKFADGSKEVQEQGNKFLNIHKQQNGVINTLRSNIERLTQARDKSNNPALINIYNKKIDEANNKLKNLTKTTENVDNKTNKLKDSFRELLSNTPFAGLAGQAEQLGGSITNTTGSVGKLSGSMDILKVAFASTGILLLVGAFVSLITYFKATEGGGDRLAKIMRVVGGVVGEVVKVVAKVGEVIFDAGEAILDFAGGADDATISTDDYRKSVSDLASEIADLEDAIETATGAIAVQNEKLQTAIEVNLKALRNRNITLNESLHTIQEIGLLEEEKLKNATHLLEEKMKLERKDFLLKTQDFGADKSRIKEIQTLLDLNKKGTITLSERELEIVNGQLKGYEDIIKKNEEKGKLFDQFIKGQLTDEELLDKAKGTFTQKDVDRINALRIEKERASRESLVLEERLQNFIEAAREKEKARLEKEQADKEKSIADEKSRREKLLQDLLNKEKRHAIELENIEKQRLLNGEVTQLEFQDNIGKIQSDSFTKQKEILTKFGKDTIDIDKAVLDEQLKNLDAFLKQTKVLTDQANKVKLEGLTGEERLQAIKTAELEEVEILKKSIEDLNVQLGRKKELTEAQLNELQILRDQANKKYLEGELELQRKEVDLSEEIKIERIKRIENDNLSEIELEKFKQAEILRVQIQAAQKRLFLLEDDNSKEAQLQKEKIKTFIADSQKELENLEKSDKKFSLQGLLGLNDSEMSSAISALKTFKDSIISIYKNMLDEEIAINSKRVSELDKSISERERALESEIKIAELGLASNIDGERKKIAEEKKQRDKAQKAQEEAQKKKQRLETIEQLIGLTTSSVNIFKALSPLGPVGIVLAVATIASMFAAFASAKSQAAKAAKLRKGGQLGGLIDAPSHERGGQTIFTDKGPMEFEGYEFINNKQSSRKHLRLLRALNRNKENEIIESMLPYLNLDQEGIKLNKMRPTRTVVEASNKPKQNYYPGMLARLEAIEKNTGKIQEKQVIAVSPGATIIEYTKNGKRIIKDA